ncbi:hypothetical protein RQN30_05450 [Arcanobacterium hippocoleae]
MIARAKSANSPDYLALNEELQATEAKLDAALEQVREAEEIRARLSANTNAAMQSAQIAISEAEDFINRYRSGIGANARTLLARAKEYYNQAGTVPLENQITLYQNANSAARQSINAAERAINNHGTHRDFGSRGGSTGDFLAGMIVSSILDGIFDGGNRGGSSGFGGFSGGDGFSGGGGFSDGGSFRKGF